LYQNEGESRITTHAKHLLFPLSERSLLIKVQNEDTELPLL